jgi:prepilin-type N-terminal cleavage/methylation domain-containing protein
MIRARAISPALRPPDRAFTLIELLIVVAIVAILTAIAVPNFLEATVRCRVARTHNDLRAMATALESYRVDNTQYPRATLLMSLPRRLVPLTTPVAYMAGLPHDPCFRRDSGSPFVVDPEYCYSSGNIYFGASSQFDRPEYLGTIYSLAGRGPDNDIVVGGYCMAHPIALDNRTGVLGTYDPTNGTLSSGDILRLSSGTLGRDRP